MQLLSASASDSGMRLGTWNEGGRLSASKGASTVAPLSRLPGDGAGTPKSEAVPSPRPRVPKSESGTTARQCQLVAGGGSLSAIREHPKTKRPASGGGNGASLLGCRLELALPQSGGFSAALGGESAQCHPAFRFAGCLRPEVAPDELTGPSHSESSSMPVGRSAHSQVATHVVMLEFAVMCAVSPVLLRLQWNEWRTLPVTGRYERNFNSPPAVITPSPGLRTLLRPCKSVAPPSASSAQAACLAAFFRLRQPKEGLSIAVARPLTSDQGGAFHGSRRGFA
jgi:hypothetical protein